MDYKNYKILSNEKQVDKLIKNCKKTGYCSLDFETSGHEYHNPLFYPTILSISFQPGSSFIIPLGHFDSPFKKNWKRILKKFSKAVLEDTNIVKIAWNFKFEYCVLKQLGLKMKGRLFDGMLAKYLLDEERPNDLKSMVARYIPDYAGYQENYEGSKLPWDQKPLEGLSKYGGLDADLTLRLMIFFENQLMNNGFYPLFRNMLMMATRVLAESEFQGFDINKPYLDNLQIKYDKLIIDSETKLRNNKKIKQFESWLVDKRVDKLVSKIDDEVAELKIERKLAKKEGNDRVYNSKHKSIYTRLEKIDRLYAHEFNTKSEKECLEPINFNSTQQMADLFFLSPEGFKFKIIKYTTDKKTKKESENPSTDESVLLELKKKDKSGFCEELLNHRGLTTLYGTFIKGIQERLSDNDKIHGRFLIHGTVTGRLCISRDCTIITNEGEMVIGDIIPKEEGIYLLDSYLEVLTHKGNMKQITHVINKGYEEMFEVELENGNTIKCTKNHIFLTDKGWLKLKDIKDESIICWENS